MGEVDRSFVALYPTPKNPTYAEELLLEWCKWWWDSDNAPVKMPNGLHVRSGVYFLQQQFIRGKG